MKKAGFVGAVAVLAMMGGVCEGQQAAAASNAGAAMDIQDQVNKMVETQQKWGPGSSTDHLQLVIAETERQEANSYEGAAKAGKGQRFAPMIKYSVRAQGAPKEKTYELISWPIDWPITSDGPKVVARTATLDRSGMVCRGTTSQDNSMEVPERPLPGEPIRLALISSDQTVKIYGSVVPFPLEGKDHGCHVSATILTPNASVVEIDGTGFAAGADVEMVSMVGKDAKSQTLKADSEGKVSGVELPFVKGESRGKVKVILKGEKCGPSVVVEWGDQ